MKYCTHCGQEIRKPPPICPTPGCGRKGSHLETVHPPNGGVYRRYVCSEKHKFAVLSDGRIVFRYSFKLEPTYL